MSKIKSLIGMNCRQGFSLVEIMTTILIFAGILALIFSSFIVVNYSWQISGNNIFLRQEARRALIFMTKELRSAEAVVPQGDQIDFSVAGIGNIRYALESNQITRKDPATGLSPDGGPVILANNISNLTFDLASNSVKIDITAQTSLLGRILNFSLSGQVMLRNS